MDESSDHHVLEFHLLLSKMPSSVKAVVELEQLHGVNGPVRGRRLETHFAIILEVCNVPLDAFGDFLGQFTCGHRYCPALVALGRELFAYFLITAQLWTFNLYTPALSSPLVYHPPRPVASVSSQHRCWKGTPETGEKR
jgi:hypothetical protein